MLQKFQTIRSTFNAALLALLVLVLAFSPVLGADSAPVFLRAWGASGTADGQFFFPYGLDVAGGKVYVADTDNDRVQVFNLDGSSPVSTPAGLLSAPHGVAADAEGNIYVANTGTHELIKLSPTFTVLWRVGSLGSGFGPLPANVQMRRPYDVAVDALNGLVYVADTYNHRVLQFTTDGAPRNAWGGPGSGSDSSHFYLPSGVAVDAAGFVYVADTYNNRVVKMNSTGSRLDGWGSGGSANGQFSQPRGIAAAGGYVYVADTGNQRVQKFSDAGVYTAKWGSAGSGSSQFNNPYAVAALTEDFVFVADTFNDRVQSFELDAAPTQLDLTSTSIVESQPLNTLVADLSAVDSNTGENHGLFVYSLVSMQGQDCSGNTSFTISGSQLRTNRVFDYETGSSYPICLRVTDTGGLFLDRALTIDIIDGSDAPVFNDTSFNLTENSAANTLVGTLTASDNDLNEDLTFTIQGGSAPSAFSITKTGTHTAALRVADPTLLNFEAYPDHTVTVGILVTDTLNLTDTATVTIYLQDINDAPRLEPVNAPFSVDENVAANTYVGHINVIDEDQPAQTVTVTRDHGWFQVSNAGDVRANAGINYEGVTGGFVNVKFTATDSRNASSFVTVRVNINDINEQLTIMGGVSIPENSAVGTMINPGNDPEKARLRYTLLEDNSGGAFEVVQPNGDLVVKDPSKLDYEALPSTARYYRLHIRVTDNVNPEVDGWTNVSISNVNEAPLLPDRNFSINENSPVGTLVGNIVATDPENNPVTYSTTDLTGPFTVASGGSITVKTPATLNFETLTSYDLPITAKDNGNLSTTRTYTIAINNVNEPITVTNQTFFAAEASPNNTSLGTIAWTDEDSNTAPTFLVTGGTGRTNFGVNAETGEVTVIDNTGLNNSTVRSFTLNLLVTDNAGSSAQPVITIQLTNSNDPPVITSATFSVPENSAAGTVVGTVQATDENGDTFAFSITGGTGASAFAIDPTSGQVTVSDNTLLNYETAAGHALTLTVQALDNGEPPLPGTRTFTINLTNVNEAPVLADLTGDVVENLPNNSLVAQLNISDPDAGTEYTFTIPSGNADGAFRIDSTGRLLVNDVTKLNFEAATPADDTFTFAVHVVDNGTGPLADDATVTLHLLNANDPPNVTLTPPSLTMTEHSAAGTPASTASATDEDGNAFTFSITAGNTNDAFTINPQTGAITVNSVPGLDFDTKPTFNLTVTATDNGTQPAAGSAVLTVNLTGINEPPVIADKSLNVVENSAVGTDVGTITAADPDAGTVLTYSIVGGTGQNYFEINTNSGQIKVKNSSGLVYNQHPSFTLLVRATDNAAPALSADATVTINVLPIADPSVTTFSIRPEVLTGSQDAYSLVVSNLGGGTTGAFNVYITLPTGISYNPTGTSQGCNATSAQTVVCQGSGLVGGNTQSFSVGVKIGTVANNTQLTATTLLVTTGDDFNPANNSRPSTVKVITNKQYPYSFEDGNIANWFNVSAGNTPLTTENIKTTPAGARKFLGDFASDTAIVYYQQGMQPHSLVEVNFDLYLANSWDGSNLTEGKDIWKFQVNDGQPLVYATFSNWVEDVNHKQTYPDVTGVENETLHDAMTGATEKNTLGYTVKVQGTDRPMSSVYHFRFLIPSSSPDIRLYFQGFNLTDESWGIDNFSVTLSGEQNVSVFLPSIIR